MPVIINISTYKFTPLGDLPDLKARLLELSLNVGLKGTILLSPEGINIFVAGTREQLDPVLAEIHTISGLEDLKPKESESDRQPYNRMLVKIKREIIASVREHSRL